MDLFIYDKMEIPPIVLSISMTLYHLYYLNVSQPKIAFTQT